MSVPVTAVMSKVGWLACAAGVFAGVVVVVSAVPVVSALFMRVEALPAKTDEVKKAAERHASAMAEQVAAVKGRSLFFIPPPKPRPKPVEVAKEPEKPKDPPPPPKPTRYGGPSIQAVVNGTVWFADGKRVAVGETHGSGGSAVKVVAADTPFGIKLKWEGVEFDVPLFERDGVIYPERKAETPKPEDKPAESVPETKDEVKPEGEKKDGPAETSPAAEPAKKDEVLK
jgi:outer membrane biosynthesis protein TonB